jgi:periplasmic protein TonB
MFAESLLESGNIHHRGRGVATTLSIAIQTLLIAASVALPMFRPDVLPMQFRASAAPIALGRPDVPPDTPPGNTNATSNHSELTEPREIPTNKASTTIPKDEAGAPTCAPSCGNLPIGRTAGVADMFPIPDASARPLLKPQPAPARIAVSQMQLGNVISQTRPIYPPMAIQTRQEGTVILRAVIDRSGQITSVQVLGGPALLQRAAKEAVQQWRYRPYILNGQPIEVETQITVNFILSK